MALFSSRTCSFSVTCDESYTLNAARRCMTVFGVKMAAWVSYVHAPRARPGSLGRCRPGCRSRSGSRSLPLGLQLSDASVLPCTWAAQTAPRQTRDLITDEWPLGLQHRPLSVLVLHVAQACHWAGQLLPQGGPVPNVHGLVHQHHGGQHFHSNQQLRVVQVALGDGGQNFTQESNWKQKLQEQTMWSRNNWIYNNQTILLNVTEAKDLWDVSSRILPSRFLCSCIVSSEPKNKENDETNPHSKHKGQDGHCPLLRRQNKECLHVKTA